MPIGAQASGAAKKCAGAVRFVPLLQCGCRASVQWRGVFLTAQRNANGEFESADQTRKNRDARIVGICCFLGGRGAQTACNSRPSDYLASNAISSVSRTMTTSTRQEPANQASAKIYQFPVGGRRAAEAQREQTPTVGTFGSWYHEAAIQEAAAQRSREH
jgi:hypothetical protein